MTGRLGNTLYLVAILAAAVWLGIGVYLLLTAPSPSPGSFVLVFCIPSVVGVGAGRLARRLLAGR